MPADRLVEGVDPDRADQEHGERRQKWDSSLHAGPSRRKSHPMDSYWGESRKRLVDEALVPKRTIHCFVVAPVHREFPLEYGEKWTL